MRSWIVLMLAVTIAVAAATPIAQTNTDERRALRERLEQRYDIVPLSEGVVLKPRDARARGKDVRFIEVAGGTIAVNGTTVTGAELRDRVGADANAILQLLVLERGGPARAVRAGEPSGWKQPSKRAIRRADAGAARAPRAIAAGVAAAGTARQRRSRAHLRGCGGRTG